MGKYMSEVVFRLMNKDDVDEVLVVENNSFTTPWSKQAFLDEMENQLAYYMVALIENKIVAYVGTWVIFDEAHITNVAVLPEFRKQTIGKQLMQQIICFVKEKGVKSMTLEVRASNVSALGLYHKLNFVEAGIRKNYYQSPLEDAMIMWLKEIK